MIGYYPDISVSVFLAVFLNLWRHGTKRNANSGAVTVAAAKVNGVALKGGLTDLDGGIFDDMAGIAARGGVSRACFVVIANIRVAFCVFDDDQGGGVKRFGGMYGAVKVVACAISAPGAAPGGCR